MKLTVAFFGLLFFFIGSTARAQTKYDSASIESPLIFAFGVTDTAYVLGSTDGMSAQFGNGGEIAGRLRVGSSVITMQKGQPLHLYWKIHALMPGDSNVGWVHLQRLSDDLKPYGNDTAFYIKESTPVDVEGMTTIIVPDTGFNAIAVEIAADSGGNSFWLDAVTLIQSGTAGVSEQLASREAVLASYPNPFEHASPATVHIDAPVVGRGELLISDALGREVERVPIGELHPGGQDVTVTTEHAGVFFARLLMGGVPMGPPLKLIAE